MYAYDRSYLERARVSLGRMLDYAVYDLGYSLSAYWSLFLTSPVSAQFECGDVSVLVGRSGIELALMVTGATCEYTPPRFSPERSPEYWVGWALGYYQWMTCLSFLRINELASIEDIRRMYSPYHEMDIRHFCDSLSEMGAKQHPETALKRRRLAAGLSQSQLADLSGIPVRTLQQYEQGQKELRKANAEYVLALSRVLYCDPQSLM